MGRWEASPCNTPTVAVEEPGKEEEGVKGGVAKREETEEVVVVEEEDEEEEEEGEEGWANCAWDGGKERGEGGGLGLPFSREEGAGFVCVTRKPSLAGLAMRGVTRGRLFITNCRGLLV